MLSEAKHLRLWLHQPMAVMAILVLLVVPHATVAQQKSAYRYFAPAFAYGRILIAASDKYVIVAMDTASAPPGSAKDALFPVVAPVGGRSLAILTGAVEWYDLADQDAPAVEAQTWVRGRAVASPTESPGAPPGRLAPRLGAESDMQIEIITASIGENLHQYTVDYHSKADLPKGSPLLRIVWVNFDTEGPTVWVARYPFTQEWRAEDYYRTRLELPRTRDLLKAPKGLVFVEEGYPEPDNLLEFLERLKAQDPSLEKVWSQPSMALVLAALKEGKGKKLSAQQTADFCRALLEASSALIAQDSRAAGIEKPRIGVLVVDEAGARWIYKPEANLQ